MVPLLPARTVGTKGGTTAGVSLCMESHGVDASVSVPPVPIVHGRGRSGRIRRCVGYQSGTAHPSHGDVATLRGQRRSRVRSSAAENDEREQ